MVKFLDEPNALCPECGWRLFIPTINPMIFGQLADGREDFLEYCTYKESLDEELDLWSCPKCSANGWQDNRGEFSVLVQ